MTRGRLSFLSASLVGLILAFSLSALADDVPPGQEELEINVIEGRMGVVRFSHKKHATDYGVECAECHAAKLGTYQHRLNKKSAPRACGSCHAKPGDKLIKVKRKEVRALAAVVDGKIDKTTVVFHPLCVDCHKKPENADKVNAAGKMIRKCRGCHPKQRASANQR